MMFSHMSSESSGHVAVTRVVLVAAGMSHSFAGLGSTNQTTGNQWRPRVVLVSSVYWLSEFTTQMWTRPCCAGAVAVFKKCVRHRLNGPGPLIQDGSCPFLDQMGRDLVIEPMRNCNGSVEYGTFYTHPIHKDKNTCESRR